MPSLSEFLGEPSVERTDANREAEAVGESSDIRYCACGCGQPLSANVHGNVKYISGHKLSTVQVGKDPDRPEKPRDIPNFPGDKLPVAVKKDIEEKCDFLLTILGMGWQSRDPICGGEFADRTDQIAQKLVPLIAKNATLLKFFTSSGQFSAALELAIVLYPIGKTVAQHHIFKTIGHEEPETIPNDFMYPVQ